MNVSVQDISCNSVQSYSNVCFLFLLKVLSSLPIAERGFSGPEISLWSHLTADLRSIDCLNASFVLVPNALIATSQHFRHIGFHRSQRTNSSSIFDVKTLPSCLALALQSSFYIEPIIPAPLLSSPRNRTLLNIFRLSA